MINHGPIGRMEIINGTQYFICGQTRIKVTEHFKERGPELADLMEKLIVFTAKNSGE